MEKIKVGLVYLPYALSDTLIYENSQAELYMVQSSRENMVNVGMGFYSISNPTNQDYLLAMEPYCVLERDYNPIYNSKYKKIFTWTPNAFTKPVFHKRIVEINHPSCRTTIDPDILVKNWTPWEQRRSEIVFIANNKDSIHYSSLYAYRLQLADLLHSKSKFKVSWYADKYSVDRPYYRGNVTNKEDILNKVKFSVCTENCYDPIYSHNYFTEKMPEVWFSGAMPIYMGCYNINDFGFAEHSYFDLRTYTKGKKDSFQIDIDALISRIESYDATRYEHYKDHVLYNIKQKELYKLISYDRVYETILNTIIKDNL